MLVIIIIVISNKKFKHISIKIPFPCLYASGIQIKVYYSCHIFWIHVVVNELSV